jgi:hypothetical protein
VKLRCAHEWDGWGRLSDDGSGHYNPNPSEDPRGGGVITLQGGAQSSPRPDTVRDNRFDYDVHEGRMQTGRRTAHAGSRLKLQTIQKGTAWTASLPAVLGKTRRTDRGDRGNVGIIRSPLRASILRLPLADSQRTATRSPRERDRHAATTIVSPRPIVSSGVLPQRDRLLAPPLSRLGAKAVAFVAMTRKWTAGVSH